MIGVVQPDRDDLPRRDRRQQLEFRDRTDLLVRQELPEEFATRSTDDLALE
jgi:hypothetical protein